MTQRIIIALLIVLTLGITGLIIQTETQGRMLSEQTRQIEDLQEQIDNMPTTSNLGGEFKSYMSF